MPRTTKKNQSGNPEDPELEQEQEQQDGPALTDSGSLDLSKAIFDKVDAIGVKKAALFFNRSEATINKWQAGTTIPDVACAQKVLDEAIEKQLIEIPVFEAPPQGATIPPPVPSPGDGAKDPQEAARLQEGPAQSPAVQEQTEARAVEAIGKAKKFQILIPVNREMSHVSVLSILGNWKNTLPAEAMPLLAALDIEHDTLIHEARNRLATRFLASGATWSYWQDSDMIAPIGNPGWFRRRTGAKYGDEFLKRAAINQLTSHGKSIVGAVYSERNTGGRIVSSIGLAPKNPQEKELAEELQTKGPQNKIAQVQWIGFGAVAVHRKVFEDMLKLEGVASTVEGKAHGFFTSYETGPKGEDVAFCRRAAEAGHPTFLDCSLFCGHIGKFSFMP